MPNRIFDAFMDEQHRVSRELADDSALLDVDWLDATHAHLRFHCFGLVRPHGGAVTFTDRFDVGLRFGEDHLRYVNEPSVVTWLGPLEIWQPNIRVPFVCLGGIAPGTGVEDLIYRVFDVITWNNATVDERDAMNDAACRWGRAHLAHMPVDRRGLKWRPIDDSVDPPLPPFPFIPSEPVLHAAPIAQETR